MAAFAKVSDVLPNWTLRLVGTIEADFQTFINEYFRRWPSLKKRVIFTGQITDKQKLYEEYRAAKIFALTSTFEGFPNVYAEALAHG
jgi:glycosyltransferase involved in cell wall biosynthesis